MKCLEGWIARGHSPTPTSTQVVLSISQHFLSISLGFLVVWKYLKGTSMMQRKDPEFEGLKVLSLNPGFPMYSLKYQANYLTSLCSSSSSLKTVAKVYTGERPV